MEPIAEDSVDKLNLVKKKSAYVGAVILSFVMLIIIILMILGTGESFDKGCIQDNGSVSSSMVKSTGHEVMPPNTYDSNLGGGQTSEWRDTGLRSNGEKFIIDITGKTFVNSLNGIDEKDFKKCRLCAKPKENAKSRFVSGSVTYDSDIHNCLCVKFIDALH